MTELKVLGGLPNVLPSGSLSVDNAAPALGKPVTFTAAFSDPDSAISGYE